MELKIVGSHGTVESVISNGQTTDKDLNKIVYPDVWDDLKSRLDRVDWPRRTSDNKPETTWPSSDVDPDKWWNGGRDDEKGLDEIKKFKTENWDWLKPQDSYNYNHFDTSIPKPVTQFDKFDFKPYMPTPAPPSARSGVLPLRALGAAVGGILVLIFLAKFCRKKDSRTRTDVVIGPRAAGGAGTVQQRMETHRRPSGQGGFPPQLVINLPSSGPPIVDLPPSYSECITKNVSASPPPYTNPTDTAPLVHNGFIEIGFRNMC